MKYLFAVITLLGLTWQANALDQSDTGNYAVVHRDGHITDFSFFVAHNAGRWNVEQRQADGSWASATCSSNCLLKESNARDLARFFTANELQDTRPSCVHNSAFAFCRQDSLFRPGEKEYSLVALMMVERPIHIQLKRIETGWKDSQGRAQPDSDARKAQNGFGGWLLLTPDEDGQSQ